MQNRDIIIVGLQSWDISIGSNCKNIALELSKSNRVLYVNRALDRISKLRGKDPMVLERIKSLKEEVDDIQPGGNNLWVLNPRTVVESVNWMPILFFGYFNRLNNQRIARQIKKAMNRLKFENPILFIDNDFFRAFHLPELLDVSFSIYYIRDYLGDHDYFKKHGSYMEAELMRKVDLVTANSPYLADYGRRHNKNSFYIGQGCDFESFLNAGVTQAPEDLRTLQGLVIGYVGALVSFRLDIGLLIEIAKSRSHWNIVLVGPEDAEFSQSELHQLPNVYFLGNKAPNELPAYINNFDVCLNPQVINQLTIGNYPRKVDEYLSMGKPVVATRTPFMELFKDYVYLCKGSQEFIEAIQTALNENNITLEEKRKKFALTHTWENSVAALSKAYQTALQEIKVSSE